MMRHTLFVAALCLIAAVGCGSGAVEVQPPPQDAAAKKMLQDMAETGQPMGSGGMEIASHISRIRQTDPAKADKLQKQFDDLVSIKNPAQVKAAAKKMLADME